MAYSREEFKALVQRLREGSEDAARELVAEYEDMVRDSVREWLDRQPRPSALDSADFSQMVFLSFFRRLDEYDFDTPEKLAGLLLTMSRNKVVRERRRSSAQKRDASREVPLEKLPGGGSQLPDKKPTLTELAVCKEYWDHQVARAPEKYRQIVDLRFAGHTYNEIGQIVHLAADSVRHIMHRIFNLLMERYGITDAREQGAASWEQGELRLTFD